MSSAPGEVAFINRGFGHYIRQIGNEETQILVAFNSPDYQEISHLDVAGFQSAAAACRQFRPRSRRHREAAARRSLHRRSVTIRWRPARFAAFLVASWVFGSLAITGIIVLSSAGSAGALFIYCTWALAFALGAYIALSFALNSTSVNVESGNLVTRSGPLQWGWRAGNSMVRVADVSQLAVDSYMTMGFLGPGGRLHRISARVSDGKSIPIVAYAMIGTGDRADAERLARSIEGMLKERAPSCLGNPD